jgi:hypothetical protein
MLWAAVFGSLSLAVDLTMKTLHPVISFDRNLNQLEKT